MPAGNVACSAVAEGAAVIGWEEEGGSAVWGAAKSGARPRLADGLLRLDARGEPGIDLENDIILNEVESCEGEEHGL